MVFCLKPRVCPPPPRAGKILTGALTKPFIGTHVIYIVTLVWNLLIEHCIRIKYFKGRIAARLVIVVHRSRTETTCTFSFFILTVFSRKVGLTKYL